MRRLVVVLLWGVPLTVVFVLLFTGGVDNIAVDVYRAASQSWWARRPLYNLNVIDGFVYLPQAAIVDSPLTLLPARIGALAWRGCGWALYIWSLWQFVAPLPKKWFLLVSLLAMPPAVGTLANGQASVHLAAFMVLALCDLQRERWWRVTGWLMLGLAVKPLILTLILLVWPLHRPLWWRIPLGLALFVLLPFMTAPPSYAVDQYHAAWIKLRIAERPDQLFEDLRSMFLRLDVWMSHRTYLVVRMVAALAALAGVVWARLRLRDPWMSLSLLAAAGVYMTLLNPRTQSSTYVLATPAVALSVVYLFVERRRAWAFAMVAVLACWCTSNRRGPAWTINWLKPFAAAAFTAMFVAARVTSRDEAQRLGKSETI